MTQSIRRFLAPTVPVFMAGSLSLCPTVVFAHDAFGELGPFYSSLLHPLIDPMQAALLIGTMAFLAGRTLAFTRIAFPAFVLMSCLSALALACDTAPLLPAVAGPFAVLFVGLAATMPRAVRPRLAAFALVAACGALAGVIPDEPGAGNGFQWYAGTVSGIAGLGLLAWFALEAISRHLFPVAPKVAGSWVAAVGVLVTAFSLWGGA